MKPNDADHLSLYIGAAASAEERAMESALSNAQHDLCMSNDAVYLLPAAGLEFHTVPRVMPPANVPECMQRWHPKLHLSMPTPVQLSSCPEEPFLAMYSGPMATGSEHPSHTSSIMAPLTRSIFKTVVRHTFEQLPDELLIEVFSHLSDRDLGAALCSSKRFSVLKEQIWRAVCAKRWPHWFAVTRSTQVPWRRQAELLSLRERELLVQPNQQAIQKTQTVVTPSNRAVLAEWLAEVSWDWQLESTIVFKAISYLDNYLAKHDVAELSRFQLVGIACLRAAMGDVQRKRGFHDDRLASNLAPDRFAYISDSTYTEAQVVDMTATVQDCTTDDLQTSPNSKMFLRSFWYRLVQASAVSSEEMHIYTLSSFFLQLTLLDLECSMLPASLLAAASLANSLEVYGKDVWPAIVQQYSAYTLADLAKARRQIQAVQEVAPAGHIRSLWRKHHEAHGYDAYQQEWQRALSLVASPCPTPAYLPSSDSLGSTTSSQTEGPK